MAQRTKAPSASEPSLDLDALIAKAEAAKISSGSRQDQSRHAAASPSRSHTRDPAQHATPGKTVNFTPSSGTHKHKVNNSKDLQTAYLFRKDASRESKGSSSKDRATAYLSKKDSASTSKGSSSENHVASSNRTPTTHRQPLSSIPESRAPRTTTGVTAYKQGGNTTYQTLTSRAPSHVKSILTSTYDRTMASRQTCINSLPPDERKKQEEWAQTLIQRAGVCPAGFTWRRFKGDSYRCQGGHHRMTDELLAEGKGGMLMSLSDDEDAYWWGPHYPDADGSEGIGTSS